MVSHVVIPASRGVRIGFWAQGASEGFLIDMPFLFRWRRRISI